MSIQLVAFCSDPLAPLGDCEPRAHFSLSKQSVALALISNRVIDGGAFEMGFIISYCRYCIYCTLVHVFSFTTALMAKWHLESATTYSIIIDEILAIWFSSWSRIVVRLHAKSNLFYCLPTARVVCVNIKNVSRR